MNPIHETTIKEITKSFSDLLTVHYDDILNTVDEETQRATVAVSVKLSFVKAFPSGTVGISFATKTKDEVEFNVDDRQEKMPI